MPSMRERMSRWLSPKVEAVGLEVGTSALKVVELRAGNPPSLGALAVRPMPPGLIQDDQVTDAAGLAEEIKALFHDAGIHRRFTVTAVSNRQAITRNIHVPRMTVQELDEAIKWEAERYIPFPIDEVMLDYFVLDNPEDVEEGGQLEVVIAAARLDEVTQQVEYLKQAGLEPYVIDVKPFSLLRSLKGSLLGEHLTKTTLGGNAYTEANEIGVVLEIAASTSTVTLVRGQRVLMNRNINVSGDDFTAAIQRAFGLDFDSAEDVKLEYGTATIPTEDEEDLLNFDAKREHATGEDPDGKKLSGSGGTTTAVEPRPSLTVTKSSRYESFAAGSAVDYTIVVRNSGNVTVSDIEIDDSLTSDESCPATELAPGEQMACTASYVVTQADVSAGELTNVATVAGVDPQGRSTSGSGRATTPFDAAPDLETVKTSDASGRSLKVGDEVRYTIAVTNTGNVGISDVVVTDALLPSLTCDSTSAAPGAVITCTGSYAVTQANLDSGLIDNVAAVSGLDPLGGLLTDSASHRVDILAEPALTVDKTATHKDANNNGRHDVGEVLDYAIEVTNTGNVTTSAISLDDPLTADESCPAAELAPGESMVCRATYTLQPSDIEAGKVVNTAIATGADPSGNPVEGADTLETLIPAVPGLTVVKSASGTTLSVGEVINYKIRVFNTGNVTVTDIFVDDPLTTDETCPSSALAAGESMTCTASYTVTEADVSNGVVENTATAAGLDPSGAPTSGTGKAEFPFSEEPAFEVLKEGTWNDANENGIVQAGETVDYKITVTNTGNVDLFDLEVSDPMTGAPACGSTVVRVGESVSCYVTYTLVAGDLVNPDLVNTASVTAATPEGDPISGSGVHRLPIELKPELTLTKSGVLYDANGDGFAQAGERIDYTISVQNTGNVRLDPVSVADPLAGDPVCDVTALAPGRVATCLVSYTLTQADADAGRVANTATATGKGPGGRLVTDDGSTTTDLPGDPKISLVKSSELVDTDRDARMEAGEQIKFTIRVTNTGTVTIDQLLVTDPLTGDPTCDSVELAPGEVATCVVNYRLTQADVDAGKVENTATASAADPSGEPVRATGSRTTLLEPKPAMKVTKKGVPTDSNSNFRIDAGEAINYEIRVTNTGNVTLTDIAVSDPLTGDPSCPATELAPGESMTCTTSYVLTAGDILKGSVRNTATVTTPQLTSGPVAGATASAIPKASPNRGVGSFGKPKTVDVLDNDARGLIPATLRLLDPLSGRPVTSLVVPGEGTWKVVEGKLVFTPQPGFLGETTPVEYTAQTRDGVPVRSSVELTYQALPVVTPPGPDDGRVPGLPGTGGLVGGAALVIALGALGGVALVARRRRAGRNEAASPTG